MDRRLLGLILILVALGGGIGAYQYWSWITRKPFNVRYGYPPYVGSAILFVAAEKGFFQEENLNVTLINFLSGVTMLQAAAAGDLDGGWVSLSVGLPAFQGGIDLRFAGASSYYDDDHNPQAHLVLVNSSIRSIGDLKGKTIASRGVDAATRIPILVALKKHGLNMSDVNIIIIASSQARLEALISGKVDMISAVEPSLTQALSTGKVRILYQVHAEIFPDRRFLQATSFFLKSFIDQNKAAVDAFIRAFNKAVDWINAHPGETREIIARWADMDLELAKNIRLEAFSKEMDREGLERIIDLMLEYGYLDSDIAVDNVLYKG